jgi:hypothetical protein
VQRPPKIDKLLDKARACIASGYYLDTSHAQQRKRERNISLPEVLYVIRTGYHEKRKDEFKEEYNDWTYAVRGFTVDHRELRIAIAFTGKNMLIITVIELLGRFR